MPKEEPEARVTDKQMRLDMDRIGVAKAAHKENVEKPYKENKDYYEGLQFSGPSGKPVEITQNLYKTVVRVMVAAVYARNPKPKCSPQMMNMPTPRDMIAAVASLTDRQKRRRLSLILEAMLTRAGDENNLEGEVQGILRTSILSRRAGIEIGYGAVRGKTVNNKYVIPEAKGKFQADVPVDETIMSSGVKTERLWYRGRDANSFFYDPAVKTSSKDSPWLCFEDILPLAYVRGNENFDAAVRKSVKPYDSMYQSEYMSSLDGFNERQFKISGLAHKGVPEMAKGVLIRRMIDMERGEVRVYAAGSEGEGYLRKKPWRWEKLEGYNFCEFTFEPGVDHQWGTDQVSHLRGIQDQMNILDFQWAQFQAKMLGVTMIEDGSLLDGELDKMMGSEFADAILYKRGTTPPRAYEGPQWVVQLLQRRKDLMELFERESHLPEWRTVGRSMRTRSATEAEALKEGLTAYINEKISRVETFMREVYRKSLQMMLEAYTEKHAVQIVGEAGAEWEDFDPSSVREEVLVDVVPYSSLPVTPSVDVQRKMQMLQVASQVNAAVPQLMNLPQIIYDVAESLMPGYNVGDYFNQDVLEQTLKNKDSMRLLGTSLAQGQGQGMGQQPVGPTPGAMGPQAPGLGGFGGA